jgi:hypothetical protein
MDEDLDIDGIHILQAPWDGLLVVCRFKVYLGNPYIRKTRVLITKAIKIHEVDAAANKLVEIDCLHDHALFLGNNQSLCLSTKECPALMANSTYLTEDSDYITAHMNNPRDIEYLTWVIMPGRNWCFLSFGPTGLLLCGLHSILQ